MYVAKSFNMKTGLYEIWDTIDDSVVKVNYIEVKKALPTTIILGIQKSTVTQPGLCNCFIRLQSETKGYYILDGYTIQKLPSPSKEYQTIRGYDIPEYISSIEKIKELMGILKVLNSDMYPSKPTATEYGYKFYARERPENCYTEYAPNLGVYTIVKMKEDNSGYDFTNYISVDFYGLLDIIFNEGKLIEGVEFISFNHLVCNGIDEYSETRLKILWDSEFKDSKELNLGVICQACKHRLYAGEIYTTADFLNWESNEFLLAKQNVVSYCCSKYPLGLYGFNDTIKTVDSVDKENNLIYCNGDGTVYNIKQVGYLLGYLANMHPDLKQIHEDFVITRVTSGLTGSIITYRADDKGNLIYGIPLGTNIITLDNGEFKFENNSTPSEIGIITPYGYIGIVYRLDNVKRYSPSTSAGYSFDLQYNIKDDDSNEDICEGTILHKEILGYPNYNPVGVYSVNVTDKGVCINIMCSVYTDNWYRHHAPIILPLLLSDLKLFKVDGMLCANLGAYTLLISKGVYDAQYLVTPDDLSAFALASVMSDTFVYTFKRLNMRTLQHTPNKYLKYLESDV